MFLRCIIFSSHHYNFLVEMTNLHVILTEECGDACTSHSIPVFTSVCELMTCYSQMGELVNSTTHQRVALWKHPDLYTSCHEHAVALQITD